MGEDLTMQQNARQRGPWFLDQGGEDGLTEAGGWVGSGAAKLYIPCHLRGHSSGREAQVVLVAKVPVALGPAAS